MGVVCSGHGCGAVVASMKMRLDAATKVIPLGYQHGHLVLGMNWLRDVSLAIPS